MTKEDKFILAAIVGTPVAIILLNKIYHTFYSFLFPCVTDSYYCNSPMMPGFLTLITSFCLVGFAIYMVFKNKI